VGGGEVGRGGGGRTERMKGRGDNEEVGEGKGGGEEGTRRRRWEKGREG